MILWEMDSIAKTSEFYRSEIHAVMTGGFATIAGTVLGAYIG